MLRSVQPSSWPDPVSSTQSAKPASQVGAHLLATQRRLVAPVLEQTLPQAPQLFGSVEVLVSQPSSKSGAAGWLQLLVPARHDDVHTPPEQAKFSTLIVEQARLQAPQCAVLASTSVSQPSSGKGAVGLVQLPKLWVQAESQTPPLHDSEVVFVLEHARPHAPQWTGFACRSTSQPSSAAGAAGWLQLPEPTLQLDVHTPAAQVRVCTPVLEQGRSQAPQ